MEQIIRRNFVFEVSKQFFSNKKFISLKGMQVLSQLNRIAVKIVKKYGIASERIAIEELSLGLRGIEMSADFHPNPGLHEIAREAMRDFFIAKINKKIKGERFITYETMDAMFHKYKFQQPNRLRDSFDYSTNFIEEGFKQEFFVVLRKMIREEVTFSKKIEEQKKLLFGRQLALFDFLFLN